MYYSFPYVKFLQMQNFLTHVPEMSDAGPMWMQMKFCKGDGRLLLLLAETSQQHNPK